jgi:ATP-dependent 26S proteasome regulatory subunit
MEANFKNNVLEIIGRIYELADKSKLDATLFELLNDDLDFLSKYFKTNKNQSFLLAIVISLNYKGDTVDINDLIEYFDVNPIKILFFSDDLNYLFEQGYIKRNSSRHRVGISLANEQMTINPAITNSILMSEPLPILIKEIIDGPIEMMEEIVSLINERNDNDSSSSVLVFRINRLLKNNKDNEYSKFIEKQGLTAESATILTRVIWEKLMSDLSHEVPHILGKIFGDNALMLQTAQQFYNNTHELVKKELCEIESHVFFNCSNMLLSESCEEKLNEFGISISQKKKKYEKHVIECAGLTEKQLFYNENEHNQIETLKKMLDETNLQQTRERLEQKKLPKGVVCLFYGPPGTGKTESVKQLAKATGRDIFKVELSETKSMWFGESEKLIKKIFTNYSALCKKSKLTPILLFNEADAVISSRKEGNGSSVDQTLNTIQNIILEELENFDGIMIATTNLEANMDTAFERRFLFKVKMDKPTTEIKAKIWLEKMEGINEEQALVLSQMFDFSGGQIDNIVRKKEIEEIVHGKSINFNEIIDFCQQENFSKSNVSRVGFAI